MIRTQRLRSRPVVGVVSNHLVDDDVHRNWLRFRYVEALRSFAAVEVVLLPTIPYGWDTYPASLARLDGLLLTGDETNLDPRLFEADARLEDYERDRCDHFRDRLAAGALRAALELDLPIFGICRGLQELNVLFGGSLHERLAERPDGIMHHEDLSLPRDCQYEPVHDVALAPDGALARIVAAERARVNSLHNQGIDRLGQGLTIEAIAPDGLVEAVSVTDARTFQIGVQWHPEWHASRDSVSQALFCAFGRACEERLHA